IQLNCFDLRELERPQVDRDNARAAQLNVRASLNQRVQVVDQIDVVRDDELEMPISYRRRQHLDHLDRRSVAPVSVVDDQEQREVVSNALQDSHDVPAVLDL